MERLEQLLSTSSQAAEPDYQADAEYVESIMIEGEQSQLALGEFIAKQYYSDHEPEFRERGRRKDYSLRKLEGVLQERGIFPIKKSALQAAASVYFLHKNLNLSDEQIQSLRYRKQVEIARIRNVQDARKVYHEALANKKLTVNQIKERVRELQPTGNKRSPSLLSRIEKAAKRLLFDVEALDGQVDDRETLESCFALVGLAAEHLHELLGGYEKPSKDRTEPIPVSAGVDINDEFDNMTEQQVKALKDGLEGPHDYIPASEAAEYLRLPETELKQHCGPGRLSPVVHKGGERRFRVGELRWYRSQMTAG